MALTPGHQLGSYEIISSLGAGGMGEVYRARDQRLGRDVALKVLPPDVTGEPGRLERFDREARAIAALNHPHIITIYSTEEANGTRFLTMELVDGCTVGDLVVSSGMAIPKFLDIAIPLADALAAAHQKQITHRDLKPGNVMVSNDGRVKVLDFGLARVGDTDAGAQTLIATRAPITHQGMIVGTMPYMSPEQVEGLPIDARTDLFSLGVIFHEMLSGERPFKGSSSPALMSAILRDAPPSLSQQRTDIPEALDRLVGRLLEKRPEDRIQTARDVFNELRQIQKPQAHGTSTSSRARAGASLRIAVLPFTVRGADADADALAAALTDDITASLAKFQGLTVVAAQATRAYKDSALDVRQIAERLGARYVIAGNVRKSGTTIRTTTQLIDAHSGEQMWSETYDRSLATLDLFAIQDDLTDHIVATVGDESGVMAQSMVRSSVQHGGGDGTALDLVVRSWAFQHRPTPEGHAEWRARFEKGVTDNPDNAELWANLANMYVAEHQLLFNPLPDPLGRSLRASRRAIELDRSNQKGWLWLGITQFHLHDRAGMEEAFERALRINPRNASAVAWVGSMLTSAGEYERGNQLTERAMAINPSHPGWWHFSVFTRELAAGNFVEALKAARRVNIPDFFWMQFAVAAASGQLGLAAEGKEAAQEAIRLAPVLGEDNGLREFVSRWYWDESVREALLEGFINARSDARAGARAEVPSAAGIRPPSSSSGMRGGVTTTRSVAVLPFAARTSDDESTSLADGLTDDITNGLSRFGYLSVLSRSGAEQLARERETMHVKARYAVEGNVRKAGTVIRVSVTLVDTHTGTNLWTSSYDHDAAKGTFAVQDVVSNAVVATVGDPTGVLVRAMAAVTADTPIGQLSASELAIRYHLYALSFNPEEHGRLRDALEKRLEREPRSAEGWAILAMLYEHEHGFGFNRLPDPLGRQRRAAERAIEHDSQSQQAWIAMASVHNFARDIEGLKAAVERVVGINPLNADLIALGGLFLSLAGEYDRARELVMTAIARKPQYPGWYHYPLNTYYVARGDYESALRENRAANLPMMPIFHLNGATVAGHLGNVAVAKNAFDGLRKIAPALMEPGNARAFWAVWMWHDEIIDRLEAGFRKARDLAGVTESK
jgi:TolB-like protein/Tfp pilus assembly protein PilF